MTDLKRSGRFLAFGLMAVSILGNLSRRSVAFSSSTAIQLDLAFTAKKAGLIFAGTVDSIGYSMDPANETALTHVYFRDVTHAKGKPKAGKLVLALRGGKTDKDWSRVVDQPEFMVSRRYIVLAYSDLGSPSNMYLPIIGLNVGFFPVVPDSVTNSSHVYDWEYRPIVRVQGHHLVVVDKRNIRRSAPPKGTPGEPPIEVLDTSEDPGTRVREAEFLRTVGLLSK